jgi:hypothetical protein
VLAAGPNQRTTPDRGQDSGTSTDSPGKRLALQVVGRRTQIVDVGELRERPRFSEIVAIGSGIEEQQLNGLFDTCQAGQAARPAGALSLHEDHSH